MRCELAVATMNVCDVVAAVVVMVVKCCEVSDRVVTGGSVEMIVVRLPWLVML